MPAFMLGLLPVWSGIKAFFSAALDFFSKPPGIYIAGALLVLAAIWYSGHRGYDRGAADAAAHQSLLDAAARQLAIAKAAQKQKDLDQGMIAAADHAGFLRGQSQTRTITITREVPVYVTQQTDQLYPLPCGLLRLHDAAAIGVDPASLDNPSGLADGAACPVKASDLAAVVVWNYGLDHEKDAQIVGLQDLVRALAAAAK